MSVFVALYYWQLCATPRATVAKLSHGSNYLLVDGFPYYPFELILNVSIPPSTQQSLRLRKVPTGNRQPSTAFREPTSHANASAHFRHVTKAALTNIPFQSTSNWIQSTYGSGLTQCAFDPAWHLYVSSADAINAD